MEAGAKSVENDETADVETMGEDGNSGELEGIVDRRRWLGFFNGQMGFF